VEISVTQITRQYLEYLDLIRDLNLDVASEYLHMAATLIRLKARELLPNPQSGEEEEEGEDGIYNREQLIKQLLEYKKYKEAAQSLRLFEAEASGSFTRGKAETIDTSAVEQEETIGNVSIFDLLTAFRRVLEQAPTEEHRHVVEVDHVRIDDRIEHILGSLQERSEVKFDELFSDDTRRIVLVVTFMAILELIKMQEIYFRQEENFGTIFVIRRPEDSRDPVEMM
jgi:segregation and condensation protein A